VADAPLAVVGGKLSVQVLPEVLAGTVQPLRAFARSVAPRTDVAALADQLNPKHTPPDKLDRAKQRPLFDPALALARAERESPDLAALDDAQQAVAVHGGPAHVHLDALKVPGPLHLTVYLEGDYLPDGASSAAGTHTHASAAAMPGMGHEPGGDATAPGARRERYSRLLSTLVPVVARQP
jgi:hypothetical protein